MSCPWNTAELSALLDGELVDARAVQVREHLGGCRECRHTFAQLERARRAFRLTEPEAMSADSGQRVSVATGADEGGSGARVRWLAGVAAIAAVVVLWLAWPLESGKLPAPVGSGIVKSPVAAMVHEPADSCAAPMLCAGLDIPLGLGVRAEEGILCLQMDLKLPGMM